MNELTYVPVAREIAHSRVDGKWFVYGKCAWVYVNGKPTFAIHPAGYGEHNLHVVMITGFDGESHDANAVSMYLSPADLHENLTKLAQLLPPF